MGHIHFIQPEERYIRSYWETFDRIAKEKKYLASEEAFPFDSTVQFINRSIRGDSREFSSSTGIRTSVSDGATPCLKPMRLVIWIWVYCPNTGNAGLERRL